MPSAKLDRCCSLAGRFGIDANAAGKPVVVLLPSFQLRGCLSPPWFFQRDDVLHQLRAFLLTPACAVSRRRKVLKARQLRGLQAATWRVEHHVLDGEAW